MLHSDLSYIPLTLSTRIRAEKFASQQLHSEKAKQVYLNTLAVAAVNNYLQYLGWRTNLENSDSSNGLMQTLFDLADLELPGYGKLECRAVSSQDQVMLIPEEVSSNRIAYIAVRIEPSQKFVQLLGFIEQVSSSTIPLSCLKSLQELPEYLEQYHQAQEKTFATEYNPPKQPLLKLSNWLLGVIEAGWENIDSLLTTHPDLVFRGAASESNAARFSLLQGTTKEALSTGVSRVKLWDLGQRKNDSKIALVISLLLGKHEELEISVKVCPTNENTYLPEGLVIKILDEIENPILQAQTKSNNERIEFFLSGELGETFSIQASLNHKIQMESFMI